MMELDIIRTKILDIRGQRVMLDFDLAILYQTETRTLKQAVRRNLHRFPEDFMFVLAENEIDYLVSQSVIPSKSFLGGAKPFAFTEQGVAMLPSVLNSEKAIEINIGIIRAFVTLRQFSLTYEDLKARIEAMEQQFPDIYKALNYLMDQKNEKNTDRNKIEYK